MFGIPVIFVAWQLFQIVESRQFPIFLKIAIVLAGVVIAISVILGLHYAMSTFLFMGRKDQAVQGSHTVTISENGVNEITPAGASNQNWKSIVEVRRTQRYILIYTQLHAAHVIPLNGFTSREEADDFYNFALHHWKKASTYR